MPWNPSKALPIEPELSRVVEALRDPALTVGAKVEKIGPVAGNLRAYAGFDPLFIDDLGRIWRERHVGVMDDAENRLECVADMRGWGAVI